MIAAGMQENSQPSWIRWFAKAVSVVFHPLFVPVYVGWFFMQGAHLFPHQDGRSQVLMLLTFFVNYTLLPLVTLLLARGVGFLDSIYLRNQRDRVIPYIATGVFYFWVWYVFKNQNYPHEVVSFGLAVFVASVLGLLLNIYFKISMHTLAMGVVATLLLMMSLNSFESLNLWLSGGLLVAGAVGTARMVTGDHNALEVYAGYFAGALAMVLCWWIA